MRNVLIDMWVWILKRQYVRASLGVIVLKEMRYLNHLCCFMLIVIFLVIIYYREIPCGNSEFFCFSSWQTNLFFNPRGDLPLPILSRGKQKGSFFCKLYAIFTQRNDIFFSKKEMSWSHVLKFSRNKYSILPKT